MSTAIPAVLASILRESHTFPRDSQGSLFCGIQVISIPVDSLGFPTSPCRSVYKVYTSISIPAVLASILHESRGNPAHSVGFPSSPSHGSTGFPTSPRGSPCTESTWSTSISTVFMVSCLPQKLNRSSSDGPSRSITSMLYSFSIPNHLQHKTCSTDTLRHTNGSEYSS